MKLNKKEVKFLDDIFPDVYYSLNVEDMTNEAQQIFKNLSNKLSKEVA